MTADPPADQPGAGLLMTRPVRLQADLSPPPGIPRGGRPPWLAGARFSEGMDAILGAGLFFLQLGYPPGDADGADSSRFLDLARRAAVAGVRVTVVLADGTRTAPALAGTGVREVALDLTPHTGGGAEAAEVLERFLRAVQEPRGRGVGVGALLRVDRFNIRRLPEILRRAVAARVDFVELPPLPLVYYDGAEATGAVPGPGDYRALAELLAGETAPGFLPRDLRVHDILLWALLRRREGPGGMKEGLVPGCQAAAALAFVSPDGTVHPCQALPFPLGRVEELADPEFWERPGIAALRQSCSAVTARCAGCRVWGACRGGCPGTRRAAAGSLAGPDPLCDLYRELLG